MDEKKSIAQPATQSVSRNKQGKRSQEELLRENLYKRKLRQRELNTRIHKQPEESVVRVDKKVTQR